MLLAAAGALASARGGDGAAPDVDFARDVRPLLEASCADCHGGREPEAGLDFGRFANEEDARAAASVWLRMRERLHAGEMPPPQAPRPDPAQLAAAQRWLSVRLGAGPGGWPLDPGRVTIRRLNRTEYENSVRDLFDTPISVASRLPPDDVGYGFDNIGDVLTVSPLLLEKYLDLADAIATQVLPGASMRRARTLHFEAESIHSSLKESRHGEVVSLYSNGEVFTEVDLPRAGDYVARARAWGQQAGPELCRMGLGLGREASAELDVPATAAAPAVYEARVHCDGGRRRLFASFLNDYYHPEDPDPAQRDRNLLVDWVEVEGPVDALPPSPAERRIYVCGATHDHARACAPAILRELASRAWRRPATDVEVARLMAQVDPALAAGEGFAEALRGAVAAILVSPNFLYRVELDPFPDDGVHAHPLSGFELAARLSYFLWSSLPDEPLRELAAGGRLAEPDVLAAQARRMLLDARADALVTGFADQWLQLRSLARAAPDLQMFPDFDEPLREAMRLETELFVGAIFREARPLSQLIDADFTFLNERLAKHYGIAGVSGEAMRRVRLLDRARGGVLTQASLLTLTSNPARTSPVKRGKFLLERILGTPPPPPPPGVGALDESPAAKSASMKERLAGHRKNPMCAACHEQMDALGFALERYGPTGALRDRDGDAPIDDQAELPDGRRLDGPEGLKAALLEGDRFTRCVAEKLFVYAVGRGPSEDDRRALWSMVDGFGGRSPTFTELVVALVGLDAFRMRRGEAMAAAGGAERGG